MKIICIDGGGIRGVFALAILQAMEEEYGRPIGDYFDIIAGTSTGAIIAASIAMKKEMQEVLKSYQTYGVKIFVRQAKIGLFKSVYSDKYLRLFFKKAFGETTLKEITKPLLIPAVDITHGKPFVHRSSFGEHEVSDTKLWDAVLSSCSAPIYFPPNNENNHYLSIDGGLWANNPSLVGLTEALHSYKEEMTNIKILSLGTGIQNIDFTIDSENKWGVRQWLPFHLSSMKVTPKLLDLALNLSSESISYQCQLILRDNYLRLNEQLGDEVPFDEIEAMQQLIELGKQVYRKQRIDIMKFCRD